ncbi:DNA-binding protein [bacterium]|nr:DNA-binding protein [bacterium]
MKKPILLTVSEVAGLLRIQRAKVYILIETGALVGRKVGGDWRIRTDSVESLIGDLPEVAFKCAA